MKIGNHERVVPFYHASRFKVLLWRVLNQGVGRFMYGLYFKFENLLPLSNCKVIEMQIGQTPYFSQ